MLTIGRSLLRSFTALPVRQQCCRHISKKGDEYEGYEGSGGSHVLPSGNPNYEGDGKTTASVLNTEIEDDYLMIVAYSNMGFRLNNKVFVIGPVAMFPKTVLQWNIESMEKVTPEAFSLFTLLDPQVDVLVIGTGEKLIHLNKECAQHLRKNKIMFEVLTTPDAIPVYNFLNAERRNVAGLFVPPLDIYREGDTLANKIAIAGMKGTLFRETTEQLKIDNYIKMETKRRERLEKEKEEKERFLKTLKEQIINDVKSTTDAKQERPQLTEPKNKNDKDKDR